ncbi:endonuclease/exonuclease/phosphatase family protein [Rhizorhabdus argentea]|uniref:endonuclease/exonuclease/phosphatase family protein n=1 Tax=Rhizorhabdus argentea TaxID=1387174 RepID=UPI0030EC0D5F
MIWTRRIALVTAGICSAVAVIGLLGRLSDIADSVNQLSMLWCPIGLLASAFLIRTARQAAIASFVTLGLYASVMLVPELFAKAAVHREMGGSGDIKLIQFNLFKNNRDPQAALDWLLAQDADIITISEGSNNARQILRGLQPDYPYQFSCRAKYFCSTLILSKRPPLEVEHLGTGDQENAKGLSAVKATFEDGSVPFSVISVHLMRPWPFNDQRSAIQTLRQAVRRSARDTLIVAGDFNTPPHSYAMERLDRALGLRRITRELPTWPALLPRRRSWPLPLLGLDHVYVGRAWRVASLRTGPSRGSDHRPVIATLALARSPAPSGSSAIDSMKR